MDRSLPFVSVVVPARNEHTAIGRCLESILRNSYPLDNLEVVVVDGMSDDGTRDIVQGYARSYPQVKLVDNPRLITPVAFNIGIEFASGDVIAIFGAHSYMEYDFLLEAVRTLAEHPEVDCVGGVAEATGKSSWEEAVKAAFNSPFSTGSSKYSEKEGYVTTVVYGVCRRDVFAKYGLFDERFVRAQDYEFNLRIVRAGGKLYQNPAIRSYYRPRSSPGRLFEQYFQYGEWKVQVLVKHHTLSIKNFIPPLYFSVLLVSILLSLVDHMFLYCSFFLMAGYILGLIPIAMLARRRNGGMGNLFLIAIVLFFIHAGFSLGFYKGAIDVLAGKAAVKG